MFKKATAATILMVGFMGSAMANTDGTEIFTEIGVTVGLFAAAAMVLFLAIQKPLLIMKLAKKFLGRST
ncbi:hypothetical protein EXU30_00320 [Shewanella maritima]|uniref:Uncharacterized protein n=1 Tax=Shewanella maritima TaxID=2520507 RepID=A0A411PCK4_9GAMM|nr:hypothetical protein [Shewanella maritima]QBF81278.1 hypothetical protein EXU30_00140 [Shewanella maritima]QBF81286.1 hypothetical protein EXU30_00180 [Shewanella maritima]QBF81295.1 hypothetical protein EXU30_00225 [Shewanella maritima]QBF81314.1 hypothetical protein EXU30_00320 [Shewanella maritima]